MIFFLILMIALAGQPASAADVLVPTFTPSPLPPGTVEVYGTIQTMTADKLIVSTKAGPLTVDATQALAQHYSIPLEDGEPVRIVGTLRSGILYASSIGHCSCP